MKSLRVLTVNEQVSDAVTVEREGKKVVGALRWYRWESSSVYATVK